MKRRFIRFLPPIATVLALFYVTLAVTASVCLFDHPASQESHHHSSQQSNKTVHSALCAWACQANPGTSLVSAAPLAQPVLLVLLLLLISCSVPSGFRRDRLFPRGPPRCL